MNKPSKNSTLFKSTAIALAGPVLQICTFYVAGIVVPVWLIVATALFFVPICIGCGIYIQYLMDQPTPVIPKDSEHYVPPSQVYQDWTGKHWPHK